MFLVWFRFDSLLIIIVMASVFIRLKNERFKLSSISRFSFEGLKNLNTGKYYVRIYFGRVERQIPYDTLEEANDVMSYLDTVCGVKLS